MRSENGAAGATVWIVGELDFRTRREPAWRAVPAPRSCCSGPTAASWPQRRLRFQPVRARSAFAFLRTAAWLLATTPSACGSAVAMPTPAIPPG